MTVTMGNASVHVDSGDGWQHIGYTSGPVEARDAQPSPSRLLTTAVEVTLTGRITSSLIARAFGVPLHLIDSSAPHPREQARRMRQWARRKGRLK